MRRDTDRAQLGMSKRKWLIAPAVILLFVSLAYEVFESSRAANYERRAYAAFRNTMLGLFNYYDAHGCLPDPVLVDDNGDSKASWRFLISNYIDATNWHIPDETKPWIKPDTSEFDLKVVAESPSLYSFGEKTACGPTRIAGVTGPDTAFDDAHRCSAFRELDDDTIMLVEVADSRVLWTEPGDFVWTGDPATAHHPGAMRVGAKHSARGFHVAFLDGSVWLLSRETPLPELSRFFTASGAKKNDREKILGRYRL